MIGRAMQPKFFIHLSALGLALALAISALAEDGQAKAPNGKKPPVPPVVGEITTGLEPKAVEILKATSAQLAAAKTMSFTAVISYENPSTFGPPLVYTTKNEVTLARPDKLRVVTPADGPRSEFFYDGKKMMAVAPAEKLIASADAPPTIEAALKAAYQNAAIYYPFSDLIVADPWGDLAEVVKHAFYIGQSQVVGGVTTDMVAFVTDDVFVQTWIGVEDKLPRMVRALYKNDPSRLRHQMELSDWKLDPSLPADTFTVSTEGMKAIEFARPDPELPKAAEPPPPPKSGKK
jgi:hypothetical protein